MDASAAPRNKLLRSCESCRASKSRCLPSGDSTAKQCQRCAKVGKECVFVEAQPRPKRPKLQSKTRVAEVERKIDEIYGLLQTNTSKSSPQSLLQTNTSPLTHATPILDNGIPASNASPPKVNLAEDRPQPPSYSPKPAFDPGQDVIQKGIVSLQQAEELVNYFRANCTNFPFIYVPVDTSVAHLRSEKPFLLLAMMAMASQTNPNLQVLLEQELRETLSVKLIMKGEKSLDLLQGILVYLAWYHFYFEPHRQQMYQLTILAVAMAVDLEIVKPAKKVHNPAVDRWQNPDNMPQRLIVTRGELETKRTLIGCYYLASCMSTAFRKPNGMRYNDYIEECCVLLAEVRETPYDSQLIHYVHLQRLAEEVGAIFGYNGDESNPLGAERVQLSVKAFQTQLLHMKSSFSAELLGTEYNSSIMIVYYNTFIYVQEVGLHIQDDLSHATLSSQQNGQSHYSSVARIDLLMGCLEAAKDFLEYYLHLPLEEIRRTTILEMAKLTYAVIVLGKLTLRTDHNLDVSSLRETANLSYSIDGLVERFSSLTMAREDCDRKDVWWHFSYVFKKTKIWYEQEVHRANMSLGAGSSKSKNLSAMHVLDMNEEVNMAMSDNGFEDLAVPSVMQDNFWEEMLVGWPTSLDSTLHFF